MRAMRLILVITAILLAATFSYGAAVSDSGSPNFLPWGSFPFYDYRDWGGWTGSPLGREGVSGAYFQVVAVIQTGGFLTDFNKVIEITATHSPSGRTYPLTPSLCRNWDLPNQWPWSIFLRPEDWMFSGTWSYTLVYKDSNKIKHTQICNSAVDQLGNLHPLAAGPNGAFPPAISNIQVINTPEGNFQVSWSGIGDNPYHVDYAIEIYDTDDLCPEWVYRMMNWRTCSEGQVCNGTYNPALNRVSFIITGGYYGRLVRLRQNIVTPNQGWPRALKQIRLPE